MRTFLAIYGPAPVATRANANAAETRMTLYGQLVNNVTWSMTTQLMDSNEMVRAILNHAVDGFAITTPEYSKVAPLVDPVIVTNGDIQRGLEYILLVKQDSGIHDLARLRGRSLLEYRHAAMCLAPAWLETLLA